MGMTNDDTLTGLYALREFLKHSEFEGLEEQTKAQIQIVTDAIDTMRKYQMMQADYENRLKADMVAMLEDLDLQIEELEEIPPYDIMDDWEHQICVRTWEVKQIIKEKINALKEN